MQTFDEPRQQGGGGCSKTLLWVLAIFGGGAILCCGGGGLALFLYARAAYSRDPAQISAGTTAITDIDIPARFQPFMLIRPPFIGFSMVIYGKAGGNQGPMLMLMSFPQGAQVDQQQMQQRMNEQLQQQGQPQQEVKIEDRNERKVMVRGEERTAFIGKGQSGDGRKVIQAQLPFTSKSNGPAMLMMIVPEEEWSEEEFDAIVKSMK